MQARNFPCCIKPFRTPDKSSFAKWWNWLSPGKLIQKLSKLLKSLWNNINFVNKCSHTPIRVKISLQNYNNLKFGENVSADLLFQEHSASLQTTDTATHLTTALLLDWNEASFGKPDDGTCLAFIQTWHRTYTCYLNRLRADQCFVFISG